MKVSTRAWLIVHVSILIAVAAGLSAREVMAQATTPDTLWATEGVKLSPAGGLPGQTLMADTGPIPEGGGWGVIAQCSGVPKSSESGTKNGVGVYTFEQYRVVDGVTSVVRAQLFAHAPYGQGGNQSIPPIGLAPYDGLRIRTGLEASQGVLSCSIFIYRL